MSNALRYLIARKRRSFIWTVACATAGSALYFSGVVDSRATLCVSCPAPFWEIFSRPQRTLFDKWNISIGNLPLFFSRNDSNPAIDIRKEPSGGVSSWGVGEGSKCCSGCLHKDTIVIAASRVGPAVVNLSVPQGFSGLTLGKSIGSGTIISPDGTILTCAHVVVDSQGGLKTKSKWKVDVTLQDGRTFEGTVVNADLRSDIAIVKIDSTTPLPTANLGSSSKLRPGEWVIAMGCPLSLQNTVTAGIISCVDRKSSDLGLGGVRREYLQTDCAINEGNSGGPLVNIDGEIIGVNILKVLAADGLGFAVPIDSVLKIMEQFKRNGKVIRGWVGLKMIELNEMIIGQLKGRDATFPDVTKGLLVALVTPGSPADAAGFRASDVVIEFAGKHVESIKEVVDILDEKVGVAVRVVVLRGKDPPLTLTIVPQPANPDM